MATTPRPFVFVIMPFLVEFDDVYHVAIKDACERADTYCERLDEQIFDERMLDRIYNQIAKADILVADMTGRNQNVFYEVGYAHALGKRVILITRDAEDIPFDLKHHYHLVYGGNIGQLRSELEKRLRWYVEHPSEETLDELGDLQFSVSGVPLSAELDVELTPSHHYEQNGGGRFPFHSATQYVPLQIAAHNRASKRIRTISFNPLLITPARFASSGLKREGVQSIFDTIRMSHEQCGHRPLTTCVVEPGGWSSIELELYPRPWIKDNETFPVVLRVLSEGPPMDFPFRVSVKIPKEEDESNKAIDSDKK